MSLLRVDEMADRAGTGIPKIKNIGAYGVYVLDSSGDPQALTLDDGSFVARWGTSLVAGKFFDTQTVVSGSATITLGAAQVVNVDCTQAELGGSLEVTLDYTTDLFRSITLNFFTTTRTIANSLITFTAGTDVTLDQSGVGTLTLVPGVSQRSLVSTCHLVVTELDPPDAYVSLRKVS